MKKRIAILFLCFLVTLGIAPSISNGYEGYDYYSNKGIDVSFNGTDIIFTDAIPIEKNGRIMVPFNDIFKAMGATVSYDNNTKEIKATLGDTTILLKEGNKDITVITNSVSKKLKSDVAPYVDPKTKRTMIPLSIVSSSFGYSVYWDYVIQSVLIVDKSAPITFPYANSFLGKTTGEIMAEYGKDIIIGDYMRDGAPFFYYEDHRLPYIFIYEHRDFDTWNSIDGTEKVNHIDLPGYTAFPSEDLANIYTLQELIKTVPASNLTYESLSDFGVSYDTDRGGDYMWYATVDKGSYSIHYEWYNCTKAMPTDTFANIRLAKNN